MRGLVNFKKEPYSAELRELPIPELGEDDLLVSVLMLLASGKIDLEPILNRVAPLEEWQEIFGEMHSGKIVKGVLKP